MYSPPPTQLPRLANRSIALQGVRSEVARSKTDGDLHGNGEENGSKRYPFSQSHWSSLGNLVDVVHV